MYLAVQIINKYQGQNFTFINIWPATILIYLIPQASPNNSLKTAPIKISYYTGVCISFFSFHPLSGIL